MGWFIPLLFSKAFRGPRRPFRVGAGRMILHRPATEKEQSRLASAGRIQWQIFQSEHVF
jgi:hypothetical protein